MTQKSIAWRWRLFVIVLLIAVVVPRMTQRGMFGDGLVYATIARNLADGTGSFWVPSFSATAYQTFHEHPPLGFATQALAFLIGGDSAAVERVYSVVVLLLQALAIMAIWRRILPAACDWWPIVFWMLPSIVTWAAVNNMLENTQTLFTTWSVYLVLRAMEATTRLPATLLGGTAAVMAIGGVLTKGPVGPFPFAIPLIVWIWRPAGISRHVGLVCIAMATIASGVAALLAWLPAPRAALEAYVLDQLVPSLSGERERNLDPLSALKHLGAGIVARMAVLGGVVWAIQRRTFVRRDSLLAGGFFLTIALSASLPVAISPKIAGAYFLPSVPFFALAVAAVTLPLVTRRSPATRWGRRVPVALAGVLVLATILVTVLRGSLEPRDRQLIASLDAIASTIPHRSTVGACAASGEDWRLRAYLQRFFRVSIDTADAPVGGWFLLAENRCAVPVGCAVAAEGDLVRLFYCSARAGEP